MTSAQSLQGKFLSVGPEVIHRNTDCMVTLLLCQAYTAEALAAEALAAATNMYLCRFTVIDAFWDRWLAEFASSMKGDAYYQQDLLAASSDVWPWALQGTKWYK